ncbi:MAG: NADH-quinone oxidoreductase subunit N [Myxococcaceae bacterium]
MNPWFQLLGPAMAVAALGALVLGGDTLLPGRGRLWGWLAVGLLLALLGLSLGMNSAGAAPHRAYVAGPWSLFLQRIFVVSALLAILGSMDWLESRAGGRQAEYLALVLFSTSGMMMIPGARDWALLVVSFELMGIPLYALAAWAKNDGPPDRPRLGAEAGLKLFVTGTASSALTFFGLALVVGLSGTTQIDVVADPARAPLAAVGMMLIIACFCFMIGAVPFHFWVPDTYQGAPTPFVAFLSVAPKLGGLAALAVVLLHGWARQGSLWAPAVVLLSATSMLVGNVFALNQSDVRRLLGFSGIAQMGYVLIGLAARTRAGLAMSLFFMATYVFTNLGAFLVLHAGAEGSGGHGVAKLAGLSRRAPALGAALLIFLLSLAGIPFVAGFWAKLFVLLAGYRAGLGWLVVLGVALAVLGLFYYLSVARSTFMAEGEGSAPVPTRLPLRLAIGACLIAVVGLGLWPRPLLEAADVAAADLLAEPAAVSSRR